MRDFGDDYSGQARLKMQFRVAAGSVHKAFITWEKYFTELGDGDPVKGEEIFRNRDVPNYEREFILQRAENEKRKKQEKNRRLEIIAETWPIENARGGDRKTPPSSGNEIS